MTTGRINQVAFLSDAGVARSRPRPNGRGRVQDEHGRHPQGASFRADRRPRGPRAHCVYRIQESEPSLADHDVARRSEDAEGRESGLWFAPHAQREGRKATEFHSTMPTHFGYAAQETVFERARLALAPRLRWHAGQDVAAQAGIDPT